jgi:hypothetical protein
MPSLISYRIDHEVCCFTSPAVMNSFCKKKKKRHLRERYTKFQLFLEKTKKKKGERIKCQDVLVSEERLEGWIGW